MTVIVDGLHVFVTTRFCSVIQDFHSMCSFVDVPLKSQRVRVTFFLGRWHYTTPWRCSNFSSKAGRRVSIPSCYVFPVASLSYVPIPDLTLFSPVHTDWKTSYRTSRLSGWHSCFVFRSAGFKARSGYQLPWPRYVVFFLVAPERRRYSTLNRATTTSSHTLSN
jgi:hypothetical protein